MVSDSLSHILTLYILFLSMGKYNPRLIVMNVASAPSAVSSSLSASTTSDDCGLLGDRTASSTLRFVSILFGSATSAIVMFAASWDAAATIVTSEKAHSYGTYN